MHLIPTIIEKDHQYHYAYDIYSKLLEERIILLTGTIDDAMSSSIIGQLLYLEAKDSHSDIYLYINSPGGSVTDGLAIVDTMNYIKCPVSTFCLGLAASFGAVLLANGEKGKRFAMPNAEILIHQPLIAGGGISGQTTDIKIHAEQMIKTRERLTKILADRTGKPIEQVMKDTERDNYMTAEEALEYGLIDEILYKRK